MSGNPDPIMLTLYADGASRGNPGPASYGAALFQGETQLAGLFDTLGIRTNNFAEYSAVIAGLQYIVDNGLGPEVLVRMDSKLVVEQLSGRWKIKHPDLVELAVTAQHLIRRLSVRFEWIPREQNTVADALANLALDGGSEASAPINTKPLSETQPRSIRAPRVHTEPTTIFLVRHGHTASTEANLVSGSLDDPELSELGKMEAGFAANAIRSLAERFGLELPKLIVHSSLKRTTDTAQIVSKALLAPCRPDSRLREISFGSWEARSMKELEDLYPEEIALWRGSTSAAPAGGESVSALEARTLAALNDLVAEHEGSSIVIVSHMMPLRAITKAALRSDSSSHWGLQFAPASVSIVRFFGSELSEVFSLNSCEHLPRG